MHQGMVSYSTIRVSDQDLRLSEDDGAQALLKSPFKDSKGDMNVTNNQDDMVEYMANEEAEDDQQDANDMQMFHDESIHDNQHQNSEHLVMGTPNQQRDLSAVQEEPDNESDQISSNMMVSRGGDGKTSTERNKILKQKGQKVMQSQSSSFQ